MTCTVAAGEPLAEEQRPRQASTKEPVDCTKEPVDCFRGWLEDPDQQTALIDMELAMIDLFLKAEAQ